MTIEEYNKAGKIIDEITRLEKVLKNLKGMEKQKFSIEGIGNPYSAQILNVEAAEAILKLAEELITAEKTAKEAELVEI